MPRHIAVSEAAGTPSLSTPLTVQLGLHQMTQRVFAPAINIIQRKPVLVGQQASGLKWYPPNTVFPIVVLGYLEAMLLRPIAL